MTVSTPAATARTLRLPDGLDITVQEYGGTASPGGTGVLLLHGGASGRPGDEARRARLRGCPD
jgi:hypothetical protein